LIQNIPVGLIPIGLVLVVSSANVYFANQAVDNTAVTHEAQCLANGVVGALKHFQLLSETAMDMARERAIRVQQLEQFIEDMGLPMPENLTLEQPARPAKKTRPEEVI